MIEQEKSEGRSRDLGQGVMMKERREREGIRKEKGRGEGKTGIR